MHEVTLDITGLNREEVADYLFGIGAGSVTSVQNGALIKVLCDDSAQILEKFTKRVVMVSPVNDSDWKHKWSDSFAGYAINDNVYIWPVDSYIPEDNMYRYNVKLHRENVFGDGHHPTTRLCGTFLYDYLLNISPDIKNDYDFIDMGTGTGILAIMARLLGIKNIELCDIEEDAIDNAYKNVLINGLEDVVPFQADVYTYSFIKRYDIITANLLTGIILDNIEKFRYALKENGVMIISGISNKWVRDVITFFHDLELKIVRHESLDEWNAFLLKP